MARKRFTAEQIISKLREAEVLLAQGEKMGVVCKRIAVTEQTYYRWRKGYGGLRLDQAKRLKSLEKETSGDVGTREIGSRASLRTSGLPSAGAGSIDPAKRKADSR